MRPRRSSAACTASATPSKRTAPARARCRRQRSSARADTATLSGLGLSAHWRKAPYALVHHRVALLAVFVAAGLAALASSSSPLVTTAAAGEALRNKLADLSSFATGLELKTTTQVYDDHTNRLLVRSAKQRVLAIDALRRDLGHVQPAVFTTETPAQVAGSGGDSDVILMARTGALAHVKVLSQVSGPGVWVSNITAQDARLKPGDVLRVDGLSSYRRPGSPRLRVKGVYRALAHSPETDYWGNFFQEIYPQGLDADVPPPYVFVDEPALHRLLAGRNVTVERVVELPVDPKHLTLAGARALDKRFEAIRTGLTRSAFGRKLGCSRGTLVTGPGAPSVQACAVISSLSAAVTLADRNASAVTPAVSLLSDLGTGIALAVAAAAGVFLVRRRRGEAALLYARGESAGTFAARSALETLVPTLAGGAAGFALAYGLTDVFAPSGSISGSTVRSALAHAAVAVVIGGALLVVTAGIAFLRLYDTGSRRLPWLRRLPWEAVLIGAAVFLFLRIRSGGGMTHEASGARAPTLAVFVFPLLLVASVAGIGARLARLGLRASSRRTARSRRPSVYLALRRLSAARGLVVLLAVVTSSSLGAFFYVETLATSLHRTTLEKAYIQTGSDAQAVVQDSQRIPTGLPYPVTRVQLANQTASLPDGTPIDVMLVDPATMPQVLHWQPRWGPDPARTLASLARTPTRPLPVIVTADLAGRRAIVIQGETFRVRTLAVVHVFPFMAPGIPLVITSYRALSDLERRTGLLGALDVPATYVWGKGPPRDVGRMLARLDPPYPPTTTDDYLRAPDVVLATRTFRFMRMIAVGTGVLALLGLLLYLQARQRSQVIASALARRMGFTRAAETASLCLELAGILGFSGLAGAVALAAADPVVRRIDPLPDYPPSPVFALPVAEIVYAAIAVALLALAAGALTSRLAERADVGEALRVA